MEAGSQLRVPAIKEEEVESALHRMRKCKAKGSDEVWKVLGRGRVLCLVKLFNKLVPRQMNGGTVI